MSTRAWFTIGALVAVVLLVALRLARHDDPAPPLGPLPPPGAPAVAPRPAAEAAPAPPFAPAPVAPATITATPQLPALPQLPPAGSDAPRTYAERFVAEPRDDRWAATTEAELRRRVGALADIHFDAVACKTSICKIDLSGTKAEVSTIVERAPTLSSLQLVLSTVTPRPDGLGLTLYADLPRAQPPGPRIDD